MTTRDIFQRNFVALFDSVDVTQEDFAKEMRVTRGLVSLWYHGRSFPRADKLEKIAQYFQIPVSALVCEDDDSASGDDEDTLLALFRQLSPAGQHIAIERVQELVYIYGKKDQQIPDQSSAASSNK